jgi:integrase
MAETRKDSRGRALRKGEVQKATDQKYIYTYTDPLGRRKFLYANDLASLREKERSLVKDQLDGLDMYAAGRATVNDTFDRYMSTKYNLRESTKSNYLYMYNHFVRDTFGNKRLIDIKYSDIMQFYFYMLNEQKISISTLDSVHCILHPTFQLAVRDDIIRKNPTDGVMAEVKKKTDMHKGIRHALTVEQQRAFMGYISKHPVYIHWWPLFTVLLGTGTRIGECIGLRWDDLDFEKKEISINHSITYFPSSEDGRSIMEVHKPKTDAGVRTIPMLDMVKDAFEILKEEQKENGGNNQEIDGWSGFIFQNRFGAVPNPQTINRTIKRITESYNAEEILNAKKEKREPIIIPAFSCHHLRHTFATRLCEAESNLKVIQSVMGHRNIETTMDIYAEATDRKKQEAFEILAAKLDNVF